MTAAEKIIMYDSPEAGRLVTVTVWEIDDPNGIIYTPKEETARYNNCTHKTCDCGKPMQKYYTKCEDCRAISARERYMALPFEEWDLIKPVCTVDADKYFFNEEDIIEYMEEEEINNLDLLICKPNEWKQIGEDYWSDQMPEDSDGELPDSMQKALDGLNAIIKTLPPQSYSRGKIRTQYILTPNLNT